MDGRVKVPVRGSVQLAFQWSLYVFKKHWRLIAVFVAVGVVLTGPWFAPHFGTVGQPGGPVAPKPVAPEMAPGWGIAPVLGLVVVFLLVILVPMIVLALVTHNEMLRGRAGLNAETLGRGPGRILGYALDHVAISFTVFLLILLAGISSAVIVAIYRALQLPAWPMKLAVFVFVLGCPLVMVVVPARLMLRLPGRALGQVLPWREVRRMGRGNTWRLVAACMLLSIVLLVPQMLITSPLVFASFPVWQILTHAGPPPALVFPEVSFAAGLAMAVLNSLFLAIDIVVWAAFLSVLYAELLPALDEPAPAAAPLDPNQMPPDY